jgi:hypothetical protein
VAEQHDLLLPEPLVVIQSTRVPHSAATLAELRGWRWRPDETLLTEVDVELVTLADRAYPPVGALKALGVAYDVAAEASPSVQNRRRQLAGSADTATTEEQRDGPLD